MKKIISLLLICISLFSLTACGGDNLKNAAWEGYIRMPFVEFLEASLKNVSEVPITDMEVSYKKGWSSSVLLDDDDVSDGAEPYTYIVNAQTVNLRNENVTLYYVFYMKFNGNTLSVNGAFIGGDEIGKDAAEECLYWMRNVLKN